MARATFKQCEIQRLLRAAKAEGFLHPAVESRADGSLRLLTDAGHVAVDAAGGSNEWDEVLPPR